jgi:gas vesicle protein
MIIKEMLEKKLKERQKKQKSKMVKKITAGAIAGIAAGVVGGVLVAPKSGKETRDDITKTARDLGENAITKTLEIKETLDNKVVATKNNAITAKEKIAKYLSDKKAEKKTNNEDEATIEEKEETDSIAKIQE